MRPKRAGALAGVTGLVAVGGALAVVLPVRAADPPPPARVPIAPDVSLTHVAGGPRDRVTSGLTNERLVSADGRSAVLASSARERDPQGSRPSGAYAVDTTTGAAERLAVCDRPEFAPGLMGLRLGMSPDTEFVVTDCWNTEAGNPQVVLHRRSTATTEVVGPVNSWEADVSDDGRVVTFETDVDQPTYRRNVYAVDRASGTKVLVSAGPGGKESAGVSLEARVSGDGRYVVFTSSAKDLAVPVPEGAYHGQFQVYRFDLQTRRTELVSTAADGTRDYARGSSAPAVSVDGRFVAFQSYGRLDPADTDSDGDVYVRDMAAGTTELVSTGDRRATFVGPDLSADGRYVSFDDLHEHIVSHHDRRSGTTRVVGQGGGSTISADGHTVVFAWQADRSVIPLDPDHVAGIWVARIP